MEAFCNSGINATLDPQSDEELAKIKGYISYAQVIFCLVGVVGNILNLRTLQSPSLQTVPFMYIRSMAVFDLIALSLIMIHFAIYDKKTVAILMAYTAYVEAPVINTFLIAGLYCAFFLTVERFMLITRPYMKASCNPKGLARKKIALLLFCSACLHTPMMLQRTLVQDKDGNYQMVNNVALLCADPIKWTLFNYYKLGRECLRFFIVILMTVLNLFIARQHQITKDRRRRLVKRVGNNRDHSSLSSLAPGENRAEHNNLMKSFTEKKLTVLMISICFIFIFGNLPQMIVMVIQNEALENVFGFQVYRYCSNLLEVVNHCLNFYVFCMASKEYTRAFLLNCICLRNILLRFPRVANYLATRRSSSMVATSSAGFGMANKDYMSMDSLREDVQQWTVEPGASQSGTSSLKSILVTGARPDCPKKKSLTIVNHLQIPPEDCIPEEELEEL
ncbi:unnamed protein product [Caenorhabditis bovis]|uniref:G-protein coupled receptors family 1 profile domain-containing protein n=1 Tax=Caenorhabditis bovis TaxID=2654633 RepID=A0A8S1ECB9_9PELO|nr:unnamed protein product [Caenorhabditis bovis]